MNIDDRKALSALLKLKGKISKDEYMAIRNYIVKLERKIKEQAEEVRVKK